MIPQKLQLKNFLSYGNDIQEIDFSPYHLMCLSGNNGHGKSALLDAMTWVIWGCARKTSGNAKADQGLLRLGQKHMMVLFDFLFNGYTYRIKREFMLTHGKPYTVLELGMIDESGALISLTEKSIRMTQAKIEQLLGLDYAAFINSAFLRQGQSNEFSKKTAKERKEILASILGLDAYEELRKRAQEKARAAQTDKDGVLRVIDRIATTLERQEPLKIEQAAAVAQLNTCDKSLAECAGQKTTLDAENVIMQKHEREQAVATSQHTQVQLREKELYDRLTQVRRTWQQTHKLLIGAGALDEDGLAALKQERERLEVAREKSIKLKERSLVYKEGLQRRGAELDQTHQLALQEFKSILDREVTQTEHGARQQVELESFLSKGSRELVFYQGTIKTFDEHAELLRKKITTLDADQNRFDKRRDTYQQFIAQANTVNMELQGLTTKQGLSQDEQNPSCPLCEQNLSASRKKFLKKKFDEQARFYQHRLNRLKKLIADLKPVLVSEHAELQKRYEDKQQLEIALIKRDEVIKQHAQQEVLNEESMRKHATVLQELKESAARSKVAQDEHARLVARDPKQVDESYVKEKTQYNECVQQVAELKYDADRHQAVMKKCQLLEQQAAVIEQREQHVLIQKERQETIIRYVQQIKAERQVLKELRGRLENLTQVLQRQDTIYKSLSDNDVRIKKLSTEREQLLQLKGRLENEHQMLLGQKKERDSLEKQVKACGVIAEEYRAIAQALGKDGIQALLIEDAIPEIEQEANALLSRLSNNQAQIFIESLRDLKKGGTKETLDINIADSAGIRPYEMFSGGEAFRIDFSLRIAISKLLARRAGTSLQTLIIDEGFGSQDEDGLTQIMEALYAVQNDFSKIIIVSHLASMKEQFPVHFVVTKGPSGSRVTVMQQG